MKKSTVAIISSLCTLVVCLGIFAWYLISNNRVEKENISLPKQEETFEYEKTASFYISKLSERKTSIITTTIPDDSMEIDEGILQNVLSETLMDENISFKINDRHPYLHYDIEIVKTNTPGVYGISFKSDTEELSAEICNFTLEKFGTNLMKKVGTGSFTIRDYAT